MRRVTILAALTLVCVSCASVRQAATLIESPAPSGRATPVLSPTPAGPLPEPAEEFHGSVFTIDAATRGRMTSSWRAGCPVPLGDLRALRLSYRGFDGRVHPGELVVHEDHARAVLHVFRVLFEARFPIARMELVDSFGGDDDRSMAANNTSAFNCRPNTGAPGSWSQHAYGLAVDINPVQNPYVTKDGVEPPAGARYADRSMKGEGLIRAGDVVVRAFAQIGWKWGGFWSSAKDYQHFSSNGR